MLDTDVILSGLRSSRGASRVLLLAASAGAITPLIGVGTLLEYEAVLKRVDNLIACGLSLQDVDDFLDRLLSTAARIVPRFVWRPQVRDPDDELFMELAMNGQADMLVTFNLRDYQPIDRHRATNHIVVCKPGDALRRLTWRP